MILFHFTSLGFHRLSLSLKQYVEGVLSAFLVSLFQHLKALKLFNIDILDNCSSGKIWDETINIH